MISYVYLAGPISGLTFAQANVWREEAMVRLRAANHKGLPQIECLSPLRRGSFGDQNRGVVLTPDTAIKGEVLRDLFDIRRADVILANFENAVGPSIGTIAEISWAYLLGKPVVLVPDPGGFCDHGFLKEMVVYRASSVEEACELTRHLLLP